MKVEVIRWTCDRCGREVQLGEKEQPRGWSTVTDQPFLATDPVGVWDICDGCSNQHRRFILGHRAENTSSKEER